MNDWLSKLHYAEERLRDANTYLEQTIFQLSHVVGHTPIVVDMLAIADMLTEAHTLLVQGTNETVNTQYNDAIQATANMLKTGLSMAQTIEYQAWLADDKA